MQILHHLTIDLARRLPAVPLAAVQNDSNTRYVEITLLENGKNWEVPDGITAAVAFRKPDKTKGIYDTLPNGTKAVTLSGSTVTAVLAPQVLSCAGDTYAAVVFHDADLNQLATFPFAIRVAANPAAGQSVSNDYYRYSTMEAVSDAVDGFLTKAEEALAAVHDTATADAPAIVCEASGQVISTVDAANRPLQGLTLYGKTTQNGTPTPSAPVPLESVGASGAIHTTVCGKNLIPITAVSRVDSGVTFTVNADGSVIANGTATRTVYFHTGTASLIPDRKYRLTGCASGGSDKTYRIYYKQSDGLYPSDKGNGVEFTAVDGFTTEDVIICISSGATVTNKVFYPMLRFASVGDDVYEPYKGQTLTASTPNGLPGIPVASGGNYTDETGQGWSCDEVDFARGVYVRRIGRIDSYAGQEISTDYLSTTGALSAGVTVLYALTEPTETPLSAQELAAYAALHSNKPNTTVYNDGGAGMKLDYVADTKLYIDQKLAAISAAMLC